MKKSFQLILLCILAGFFSTSSAQKDKVIYTNHNNSIRSYIAPLITGDDIQNVYPQSANYWTGSIDTSGGTEVSLVKANGNGVGWMVFDISEIPAGSEINSVTFYGYVYDNNWPYWSVTPMGAVNPLTPNPPEIILQIISNYKQDVAYSFNPESGTLSVGWLSRALGNNATADLQNAIPQGWFALGFTDFDISTDYYIDFQGWAETNVPYLIVDCTSPTPHDVGTLSINVPSIIAPGSILPKATVISNSNTTETFNVIMTITPGGYSSTKTVTNITPGGIQQMIFDEWNANSGEYFVEVCTQLATDPDPSNDCKSKYVFCYWTPHVLLTQPPNEVNGLFADSDCQLCGTLQQTVADNFVYTGSQFTGGIAEIVIWGGYYPEDIPNTTDNFTIITHIDAGGEPGAVIDSRSGLQASTRELTGIVLFGTHEYKFTFDFNSNPILLSTGPATYWIELYNNSVESGNFYWETGNLDPTFGVAGSGWNTSTPGTSWNIDPATDMSILIESELQLVPVELVSFQATTNGPEVNLKWATATEMNNQGFEVHRKADNKNEWEIISFVPGHGTTTETQQYSFTNYDVKPGNYKYKLKQIDYDGSFEYSQEIEAEVSAPLVFSLEQNYPNPFNPSTKISWQLPVGSQATLKVYDVLGNEIATLVNEVKAAGKYEIEFNASELPSRVYFYKLQAGSFVETKKMILLR
jgi:Secretion system C-terminal sorting domain